MQLQFCDCVLSSIPARCRGTAIFSTCGPIRLDAMKHNPISQNTNVPDSLPSSAPPYNQNNSSNTFDMTHPTHATRYRPATQASRRSLPECLGTPGSKFGRWVKKRLGTSLSLSWRPSVCRGDTFSNHGAIHSSQVFGRWVDGSGSDSAFWRT
jgi:hypothetical protein